MVTPIVHELVPCARHISHGCSALIDARRAALPRVGAQDFALCAACNASNLMLTAEARALQPEYETAVWSRGGRL